MAFTDAKTVPKILKTPVGSPERLGSGDNEYGSGGVKSLFRRLTAQGVALSVDGDGLAIDAPAGVLGDELLGLIRAHRDQLLALVRMVPRVVHLKQEPFDVRIDRRSRWGNPFVMDKPGKPADGDRAEVIAKYRAWVLGQAELMALLPELVGKRLGCWCSPRACHGDVLADLVIDRILAADDAPEAVEPVRLGPGWVCPWCRSGDRLAPAEPDGLRCGRCDRLAFRFVGDGVERCDWVEPMLVHAPKPLKTQNPSVAPEPKKKRPAVVDAAGRSLFDPADESG